MLPPPSTVSVAALAPAGRRAQAARVRARAVVRSMAAASALPAPAASGVPPNLRPGVPRAEGLAALALLAPLGLEGLLLAHLALGAPRIRLAGGGAAQPELQRRGDRRE